MRRGLSRKCIFHAQIQAAITGFLTFYWSENENENKLKKVANLNKNAHKCLK